MSSRWSPGETEKLSEMRSILASELACRRQLPDVVGDRRLLRFLRGHKNVPKACEMYSKFLRWRDQNNVDLIRDHILYGGISSVYDFPCARKIMNLVPQIVIAHDALDKYGNPITLEQFSFDPDEVLKQVTQEEYLTFMIYTLEYKILVLEQLAHEREKAYLARVAEEESSQRGPYGTIIACTTIRDFDGVGLGHMGASGKTVLKWILSVAADNYPETLFRSHMIKVPWMFNTLWYFIKGLLDASTVAKVAITGADFMETLLKDMPIESIPKKYGGLYEGNNTPFAFDLSEDGPFQYLGQKMGGSVVLGDINASDGAHVQKLLAAFLTAAPLEETELVILGRDPRMRPTAQSRPRTQETPTGSTFCKDEFLKCTIS